MLQYYKEIKFYIQKLVGDKEYAVDLVQETYTKVIASSRNKKIKNERAFLYKVAKNTVIDESRKRNIQNIVFEEEEHFSPTQEQPEEIIFKDDRAVYLQTIIDTLPSRSKQAFVLHVIQDYSRQEIADKMGISVNAVQKHITRATEKIKEKIDLEEYTI